MMSLLAKITLLRITLPGLNHFSFKYLAPASIEKFCIMQTMLVSETTLDVATHT